jgi:hypothetical protein
MDVSMVEADWAASTAAMKGTTITQHKPKRFLSQTEVPNRVPTFSGTTRLCWWGRPLKKRSDKKTPLIHVRK